MEGRTVTAAAALPPGFERMLCSVPCPHCQAAEGQPCTTSSGRKADLHAKRCRLAVDRETRDHAVHILINWAPAGLKFGDEVITRYVQLDLRRAGHRVYARIGDRIQPVNAPVNAPSGATLNFVRWATPEDLAHLPVNALQLHLTATIDPKES